VAALTADATLARSLRPTTLACLVWVTACGGGTGGPMRTTFDPCEPLVVGLDAGVTDAERASVEAAVALWNRVAAMRLTTLDPRAPVVPLHFQAAANAFHGLYDDAHGVVYVNQALASDLPACTVAIEHELGHSFGLLHVPASTRASLMNPGNLTVGPTPADVTAVAAMWGACPAP